MAPFPEPRVAHGDQQGNRQGVEFQSDGEPPTGAIEIAPLDLGLGTQSLGFDRGNGAEWPKPGRTIGDGRPVPFAQGEFPEGQQRGHESRVVRQRGPPLVAGLPQPAQVEVDESEIVVGFVGAQTRVDAREVGCLPAFQQTPVELFRGGVLLGIAMQPRFEEEQLGIVGSLLAARAARLNRAGGIAEPGVALGDNAYSLRTMESFGCDSRRLFSRIGTASAQSPRSW